MGDWLVCLLWVVGGTALYGLLTAGMMVFLVMKKMRRDRQAFEQTQNEIASRIAKGARRTDGKIV